MALKRVVRIGVISVSLLAIAVFVGVTFPLAGLAALRLLARLTGGEVDANSVWISFSVTWRAVALIIGVAAAVLVGWRVVRRARPREAR